MASEWATAGRQSSVTAESDARDGAGTHAEAGNFGHARIPAGYWAHYGMAAPPTGAGAHATDEGQAAPESQRNRIVTHGGGGGGGGGGGAPRSRSSTEDPAAREGARGPQGSSPAPRTAAPTITSRTHQRAFDGTADARTTVGVGEQVTFTGGGSGAGGGTWAATLGTGTAAASGATYEWTAPDVAGSAAITLTVGGVSATTNMTVVKPDRISFRKDSEQTDYAANKAGTGMWCRIRMHPTNVSFGAVYLREVPGGPTGLRGYFATHGGAHMHNPAADPVAIGHNNDFASAEDFDSVASAEYNAPWAEGYWEWQIPNMYRVGAGGAEHDLATTVQSFHMTGPDGHMVVRKQEAQVERTPTAPAPASDGSWF